MDQFKLLFLFSSVLKYIIVALANGILIPWGIENLYLLVLQISSITGPFRGGTNDAAALIDVGFIGLMQNSLSFGGIKYCLLGDKIFGSSDQLIVPFGGHNLTVAQRNYNRCHSQIRIMVEWGINLICVSSLFEKYSNFLTLSCQQMFTRLRGTHNLRVLGNPLSIEFLLAVDMVNIMTCMRRTNQIVQKFGVPPPTVQDYLRMRQ